MKIIIDLGLLPKKQLLECRADIQRMLDEFLETHPDIVIPGNAISVEGDLFGLFKLGKGVFF